MKELLEFLKANTGALYYDKDADCFVITRDRIVDLHKGTVHCAFKGCDDAGIIPKDVGPEWVMPAILSLKRFGP